MPKLTPITDTVTPILDVSRKSSMCVEFSTGYIKIYNIKEIRMNLYTTKRVRTLSIHHILTDLIKYNILDFHILHASSTNELLLKIHPAVTFTSILISETNKDWDET
jgi:hypothetical protein